MWRLSLLIVVTLLIFGAMQVRIFAAQPKEDQNIQTQELIGKIISVNQEALSFDMEEAVGLEGNSGPYIQYAFARANSILEKSLVASRQSLAQNSEFRTCLPVGKIQNFDHSERSLARKITEYPEVVARATNDLMPHHICTYLYELAQSFNSFYEKSRIIGDERQGVRLELVKAYSKVLKNGLNFLNIAAPEHI